MSDDDVPVMVDDAPQTCKCGLVAAPGALRCDRGHVLSGHPGPAFRHGVRQYEARGPAALPETLRLSADGFRAQLIADKGGVDNLTTLEGAYIQKLVDVDIMGRLLINDLRTRGIFTPKGRVRNTFGRLLETFSMWDRFASKIGVERKAKPVNPIDAIAAAVEEANRS